MNPAATGILNKRRPRRYRQYTLRYIMLIPAMAFVIIFAFIPIWGLGISFFDYNVALGFSGSPFAGLKHFIRFFSDRNFWNILRNTVAISLLGTITGNFFPILFGLLLNELIGVRFKKLVQTVSYLPHFISYIVVANLALTTLGPNGFIMRALVETGILREPVLLFAKPEAFWLLITGINIWKEMGWSAIIFISAMSGIDQSLYDAAMVDGAGRFRRIWHITIPGILPTIAVLLIMDIPGLISAGFEPSYILGNAMVQDVSEVIDTYVFRIGLGQAQYSLATAVSFVRMLVGYALIVSANGFARRFSDYSIY